MFDGIVAPPSLKTVPVPMPDNLASAVSNMMAAEQLGKALYWDMQVGSDGIQACASCHFHAGADFRVKNQVNPGPLDLFSSLVASAGGPNSMLKSGDFPLHRLLVPDDNQSPVLFDTDDRVTSQGVFRFLFTGITTGNTFDDGYQELDPNNFSVGGINVRRCEPRNTPTVINAVFFHRIFHDGRANHFFNGKNPFGDTDPDAKVLVRQMDGSILAVRMLFNKAATASQAVGPPGSPFEMSHDGRDFDDIGYKMTVLRPLNGQLVHAQDSVLGGLSAFPSPGLGGAWFTYTDMIKSAFHAKFWDQDGDGDPTDDAASFDGYRMIEKNFSLFFGLAILVYESTLVSDDAPYDKFKDAGGSASNALTSQQKEGLDVFLNRGRCIECHAGPEFAGATMTQINATGLLRRIQLESGPNAVVDNGFLNIGMRPTVEDPGVDGVGPFGTFSLARRAQLGQNVDGGRLQPPVGAAERLGIHGAFKIPTLRNIELTGPFGHQGGFSTLEQVVDFYAGGAHFENANLGDLARRVSGIGGMDSQRKAALVAFLKSLTDERVRREKEPFDHPQLFVPDGQVGDNTAVTPFDAFRAQDVMTVVPAVGKYGTASIQAFETLLAPSISPIPIGVQSVRETGSPVLLVPFVLGKRPTANVRVNLSVSDASEGVVSPAFLTFTPSNWNLAQIARVRGVQDNVVDGNQLFMLVASAAISADPQYSGLDVPDVKITAIDSGVH